MKLSLPQEEIYWQVQHHISPSTLQGEQHADVVIVGGGMAGIIAALKFQEKGRSVILVEKDFCGAGASGKSTGFITPNAELGLTHYVDVFGIHQAKKFWDFVMHGVHTIHETINQHNIPCDYTAENTLIVANSKRGLKELQKEHENYQKLGFQSELYAKNVVQFIGSKDYYGGLEFGPTFGINVYAYLQGMKHLLLNRGVKIYESSPVVEVQDNMVKTLAGSVKAETVVVCMDRYAPQLELLAHQVYQAETFILASSPLSQEAIKQLFPKQSFMVWDTDLVYQYFRLTGDNRLIIGGATIWRTFHLQTSYTPHSVYKKLTNYLKKKFPSIVFDFQYMWPGLIGVTQDMKPIAGRDAKKPSIYYVAGATGLPWAAALGSYAADAVCDGRNDFDPYFNPYRSFMFGPCLQKLGGKANCFAFSNLVNIVR